MCERKDKLSKTSGTGDIRCPFFNAHNREIIRCEGAGRGMRYTTTQFEDAGEKTFHQKTYCEAEFRKCWIYRCAMEMKYSGEE